MAALDKAAAEHKGKFERHSARKRSALRLYPKGSVANPPLCTSVADLLGKSEGGKEREKTNCLRSCFKSAVSLV